MNKLTRYKRNRFFFIGNNLRTLLKDSDFQDDIIKPLCYEAYKRSITKIKFTKRVPQKQYKINLDVCNID